MRGNRSQTYSFWSDSEPKPVTKRNAKKPKQDAAVAAKKSDLPEAVQVTEPDIAKPSCSTDDEHILLKTYASIEDLTKDVEYRDLPDHVILDFIAAESEELFSTSETGNTVSYEALEVIEEILNEENDLDFDMKFTRFSNIHEQLEGELAPHDAEMAVFSDLFQTFEHEDCILMNDPGFPFKDEEADNSEDDSTLQETNKQMINTEIPEKGQNQFCEFHCDDYACHLPKSNDVYCSHHFSLLTPGSRSIFDENEELLFTPRHGCAVAEPRIHAYDPCTLNSLHRSTFGDVLRNMKEITNAALEAVSAKEMWLRVRKDDYFRTGKSTRDGISGSNFKREPLTNLDSVEAVLNLERMHSFNHNLETRSLAFVKEDDLPYSTEIDFLHVWDNVEIEEEADEICVCGKVLQNQELCECKEVESSEIDHVVEIGADDSVVYRYLNETFQNMPAELYEKMIYPPIPWASIMRGSVDGEIYECFEETTLPTSAKELVICALENCLFVKKVFPKDFKYKVKLASEENIGHIRPEATFNIEALSSESVVLSECYDHQKSFIYPLIWRFTLKYDVLISSLKVNTDKINWSKIDRIGVLRNVYTKATWKQHEDEKARIADELARNPPPKPSFFADIIANRTYYYKPPDPTTIEPQTSRKRKTPTGTCRPPMVRQTVPSTSAYRQIRAPTSHQIPTSNQTYTQIPIINQAYAQRPKSQQPYAHISPANQNFIQISAPNQAFIEIPTSSPIFTHVPTSNQSYIEIPVSNRTFVSTSNPTFIEIPTSNQSFIPTSNQSFIPTSNPSFIPTSNQTYIEIPTSNHVPTSSHHLQYAHPQEAVEDDEMMEIDPAMPQLERMTYNEPIPAVNQKPMNYFTPNSTYYMSVPTSTVALQENDPIYSEDYIFNGYCNGNG